MSTTTTNLGLIKPELTDVADITTMNLNWDKIDAKLADLDVGVSSAGVKIINATSANGVEYVGTADGVTELTAGLAVMFVPNMTSTNTTPTFNLNDLGAKNIRRKLSIGTATTAAGDLTSWFYVNRPSLLVYDGTQWIAEDFTKPCATDLYGAVEIENGGTGGTDASTARTNLDVYSKGEVDGQIDAQRSTSETVTVTATSWTGEEAPYTATVASTIATATNNLIVGVGSAVSTEQQEALAAAMIICTAQAAGSITLTAYGDKPEVNLPVNIICVG